MTRRFPRCHWRACLRKLFKQLFLSSLLLSCPWDKQGRFTWAAFESASSDPAVSFPSEGASTDLPEMWLAFRIYLIHHREEEGRPSSADVEPSSSRNERVARNVSSAGYTAVILWPLGSCSVRMALVMMVSGLPKSETATASLLLTAHIRGQGAG